MKYKFFIGALIGGIVVLSIVKYTNNNQPKTHLTNPKKTINLQKDSDKDGLKDWEELLAGTDPNNPDTDNDGIPDKKDQDSSRKPIIATTSADVNNATTSTSTASSTLTDKVARKIFDSYFRSKISGTFDKNKFKNVVDNISKEALGSQLIKYNYQKSDLKQIKPTKTTVRRYKQEFEQALKPVTKIPEYELTTFARAIEKNDANEFAKLQSYSDAYKKAVANLMSIKVPADAVAYHLQITNSFNSFSETLEKMSQSKDDPILAYALIRKFMTEEEIINKTFESYGIYYKVKYGIEK